MAVVPVSSSMLPFETEHLARVCARLHLAPDQAPAELSGGVKAVVDALRVQKVAFVSARIPDDATAARDALIAAGFTEVESLVTLACDLSGLQGLAHTGSTATQAVASDADACAALAGRSFRSDRFHADPDVPDERADALKAAWMRNNVLGRADVVLISRRGGEIVGINACLRQAENAVIDLICTAPEAQRQGIGRALVRAALAHYAPKTKRLLVGTQASNDASLHLYRSLGFSDVARQSTFHLHLN